MDRIFKALNDPTRRLLLDRLRDRDGQSLQDLEGSLEMTRFGVMKHLKLLEEAGLVVTVKRGRFKYHYLNAVPLQEVIDRWIEPLIRKPAARGLLELKAHLEGADMTTETLVKPDFVLETFIRTDQTTVWDAIMTGRVMAQHHFACSHVDGDADSAEGMVMYGSDGQPMLIQKVRKAEPKSRVEMTFEPQGWEPSAVPSRCAFILEPVGPAIKLRVEHYDIPAGQDGVKDGWARWVSSLKSFLETGQPMRMPYKTSGQGDGT
ncbi:MAG: SRPBCC domain-containing protein [Pseudomonadota bacterium]